MMASDNHDCLANALRFGASRSLSANSAQNASQTNQLTDVASRWTRGVSEPLSSKRAGMTAKARTAIGHSSIRVRRSYADWEGTVSRTVIAMNPTRTLSNLRERNGRNDLARPEHDTGNERRTWGRYVTGVASAGVQRELQILHHQPKGRTSLPAFRVRWGEQTG